MPLLVATLQCFAPIDAIVEVVVAAPPAAIGEVTRALAALGWEGRELRVVAGGSTRQASVRAALGAVSSRAELVCVHDAARPLVRPSTIERVLQAAARHGAAAAAHRAADSIRQQDETGVARPVDRSRVFLVETPQAFERGLLIRAHDRARVTGIEATDDAELVERCAQGRVHLVETAGGNPKVTTSEDLELVRAVIAWRRATHR